MPCLRIEQLQVTRKHVLRRGWCCSGCDDIEPERRTTQARRLIDQCGRSELAQQGIRQSVIWTDQEHGRAISRIGENKEVRGIKERGGRGHLFGQIAPCWLGGECRRYLDPAAFP